MRKIAFLPLALMLSGCMVSKIASTAVDVATLPVKVASSAVDAATTSQSEADEKRGRQMRKEDERRGREAAAMAERCRKGRPLHTDICTTPRR
jgi:isocitrate lyase